MATLLIETKEVKALQVHVEDLADLARAVHKKTVRLVHQKRSEVLVDVGRFSRGSLSSTAHDALDPALKVPAVVMLSDAIQDLVNRDELPEGHYLVNLGKKVDEFADGGTVKPAVIALQAALASAHYGEAVV